MTIEESKRLVPGIYRIFWRDDPRPSVAAVGMDSIGGRWFAATNWISVPSYDWTQVEKVSLITTQNEESSKSIPYVTEPQMEWQHVFGQTWHLGEKTRGMIRNPIAWIHGKKDYSSKWYWGIKTTCGLSDTLQDAILACEKALGI